MVTPYLPDIMSSVVQRVSDYFEARETDPFAVFFDKGNHPQVTRAIYDNTVNSVDTWPLVWMELPSTVTSGNANPELYLVMPTDNKYTQQQREDINYKPRLLPVCERVVMEIGRDRWFQLPPGQLQHTMQLLPFWGMGAPKGTDKENALGKFVDAIRIRIPKLPIKKQNCNVGRPYPQLT